MQSKPEATRWYHCKVCTSDQPFKEPHEHSCNGKVASFASVKACQGSCSRCMLHLKAQAPKAKKNKNKIAAQPAQVRKRTFSGLQQSESDRRKAALPQVLDLCKGRASLNFAELESVARDADMDLGELLATMQQGASDK